MKATITTVISNEKQDTKDTYKELLSYIKENMQNMDTFNVDVYLQEKTPVCTIKAKPKIEFDDYDKLYYARWNLKIEGDITASCNMAWDNEALRVVRKALDRVYEMEKVLALQMKAESLPSFNTFVQRCEKEKKQFSGFYPVIFSSENRLTALETAYKLQVSDVNTPDVQHFYLIVEDKDKIVFMTDLPFETLLSMDNESVTMSQVEDTQSQEEVEEVVKKICDKLHIDYSFYGTDNDAITWDFNTGTCSGYIKFNDSYGYYLSVYPNEGEAAELFTLESRNKDTFIHDAVIGIPKAIEKQAKMAALANEESEQELETEPEL